MIRVYGVSIGYRWWTRFRLCLWNGDTFWLELPLIYFGIGTKSVELSIGQGKYLVSFEIRWRWD